MSIVVERALKLYGALPVVNDVSLEVRDGELFVLLGPSGSGKSTLLRLIAGLADLDMGRVVLHGRDVTRTLPQKRNVGFVFQHYALFRHMTVAENVEFPLRIRKVAAPERRRRRDTLLDLVGLAGFEGRAPDQLSGGQQQRVALARALIADPAVLLLDEPFGALDARIRADLRRTVKRIQRELGIATIFVTHDQEEAFEMADRLGVMNFGRLLEVGNPQELYFRPETEFVATFLGRANLMVGESNGEGVCLGPVRFPQASGPVAAGVRRVQILFRPEDVAVKDAPEALEWPLLGEATVDDVGFSGSVERLRLRLPRLEGVRPIAPAVGFGSDTFLLEASRSQHQARRWPLAVGDHAWVGVRRIHVLPHAGLSLLVLSDGSAEARAAVPLAGMIARHAHGRLTFVICGLDDDQAAGHLQEARDALASGVGSLDLRAVPDDLGAALEREVARQPHDLVIVGTDRRAAADIARALDIPGEHHVLLAPAARPAIRHALICVLVGEPGKEDVTFAGRLLRHLGAEATLLTVLPAGADDRDVARAERFLAAGARTLASAGVAARTIVRRGRAFDEILSEVAGGPYDLVVIGTPQDESEFPGARAPLGFRLLSQLDRPVLIVRPHDEVL